MVVVAMVVTPGVVWLTRGESGATLEALVPTAGLVAYAVAFAAAISVYLHWRLTSVQANGGLNRRLSGWLTIGLIVGSVHGFVLALAEDAPITAGPDQWPLVSEVVAVFALCLIARAAERVEVPSDPGLFGLVTGLGLSATTLAIMQVAPSLLLGQTSAHVLNGMLALGGLALAAILLHISAASLWVRKQLALAASALVAGQVLANFESSVAFVSAVAIAAHGLGAVVLCVTAHALLRRSMLEHQEQMRLLHTALQTVSAETREHQELLHEVGSTVAGIVTAKIVIRQGDALPELRRQRLEMMLESEFARLGRLMNQQPAVSPAVEPIDVDDVVEPLVTSHQARGLDVEWSPSGHEAIGDADDLSEVVNILLENAARHGGHAPVTITVTAESDMVQVICSDHGPGVAAAMRHRLFESGARGPESSGQGLGLAIAHRLMSQRGGSLELVDDDAPGATFIARLPRNEMAHVALSHAS